MADYTPGIPRSFADDIDDAVDRWHDGGGFGVELYDYLGWSWAEYSMWVETGVPVNRPLKVWP